MADAVVPPGPPSNVFGYRGTRCTPGGNPWFPAPSFERQARPSLGIAGDSLYPGGGGAPLHPAWGTGVLLWLAPSFSGGIGLACAVVPPGPPSNVFGYRGTPPAPPGGALGSLHPPLRGRRDRRSELRGTRCTPGAGCAPCALLGGRRFCCGLRPPSAVGLGWRAPLSHLAHPPTFLETGGLPLYPRRGLRPLHPDWGTEGTLLCCLALPDPHPSLPPSTGAGTEPAPAGAQPRRPLGETTGPRFLCHTQTPISVRWLSSVSAQTRASRRSGLAPLSGVQVQSWSSRSSRPGPTWKTLPCS